MSSMSVTTISDMRVMDARGRAHVWRSGDRISGLAIWRLTRGRRLRFVRREPEISNLVRRRGHCCENCQIHIQTRSSWP